MNTLPPHEVPRIETIVPVLPIQAAPIAEPAVVQTHNVNQQIGTIETKQQRGVSLTRLRSQRADPRETPVQVREFLRFIALCTLGISVPFIGARRVRKATKKHS